MAALQDVADLEAALDSQIKALRSRLNKLEAQIDFQSTVKSLEVSCLPLSKPRRPELTGTR